MIYSHIKKNALPPDIIRTNLLTKFHTDRKINVASRVLTRKNALPPGGHVFQPTSTTFKLVHDIIGMNLLTKVHEDQTINVASRVKNAPPLGSHVFQANVTIFELIQDIIETNLLTKFHEDWTINVASRVFTRNKAIVKQLQTIRHKNNPPLGSHVFQANVTIFEVIRDIIETNLLTKFHEDYTINVASRVLTRKTAPPPGGHVFSPIWTIFKLFGDDWAKIVYSRVFTRFLYSHIKNTAPPPGCHLHEDWASNVTSTVFTSINGTNVLTKFHEDRTINVASRVFTRQMLMVHDARHTTDKRRSQKLTMSTLTMKKTAPPPLQPLIYKTNLFTKFHDDWTKNVTSRVHVIQLTGTIFKLNFRIKETNVLTKFHEIWAKNVTSRVLTCLHYIHIEKNGPPTGGHVFSPIWTIFELVRQINKTYVLINFHDDWAKIVTSRVFTRKTALLIGGHLHEDMALNVTSTVFKLDRDIIGTNLLTKFHEDRPINVASRVFTNK
ncbi:hypothetical protein DPMN_139175 [Dreissena polymorpha]|uniref:Uncharacterized protein n=1 Tax=Dreissena polymorpha TaxID=45954 RepID=A0A9D4G5U7_DREPO|nr:hypothetical protein DPMN_139175 [Dreissena polymorpha]